MGGITLEQIVDRAASVLASDSALADWCATTYDRAPLIMLGIDERNRPGCADCPLILIRPDRQQIGQEIDAYEHVFQIDWAVCDEEVSESGGVRELVGVRRVDQLGRLIWAAIEQNFSENVILNQSDYALETVERFPLLLGGMDITLRVPKFFGADRTL